MRTKVPSVARILLLVVVTVFVAHLCLVLAFSSFLGTLPSTVKGLLEALVLILLIFPVMYLLVHRPLAVAITKYERTDEALRESENRYRTLAESAPDMIFVIDAGGCVRYVNSHAASQFGLTPEQIVGKTRRDLFPPGYGYDRQELNLKRVFESGSPLYAENETYFLQRQAWLGTWLTPIKTEAGEVTAVMGVSRDITDRKQAEEALRVSEEKYRSLVQHLPVVTWTADRDGNVVFISANVEKIEGYTPAELYEAGSSGWLPRIHPDDVQRVTTAYQMLFEGRRVFDVEYRLRRKDGNWVWLHDRAVTTYERDGVLYADGLISDITERKRLEEFREGCVYSISHDLRNPLAAIQGLAQFLVRRLEKAGSKGSEWQSARGIIASTERMDSIIQDLLDSARLEAGQVQLERQPLELEPFVSELLARSVQLLGQRVRVDFPKDLPLVSADANRLERILMNLLTNAIKYSPPDTEVIIGAKPTDEGVTVFVADRGSGIAPEDLPHIFDRFYRVKGRSKTDGLGLGLEIAKGLVEAHGGRIWVESEVEKGSTFCFSLRLAS